jgi:DNA-binding NarL/FixJ family response regulator
MLRVLVVEDEALVQLGLISFMQMLGYEVCGSAVTADEAIAIASRERPDVVLMDVRLAEGSDGVLAATAIRDRFDVPSIFISANLDSALMERAKACRPLAFINKPFDPALLGAVLSDSASALAEARGELAF